MFTRFLSMRTSVLLLLLTPVKSLPAQLGAANSYVGKTAGEAYHNIQVLKDVPADDLIPAMQFITYSLGVQCSYCHVEGALEKDDKKPKLTARKMMRMMFEINQANFDSKQVVTCNSCHRGSVRPVSIPAVSETEAKPSAAEHETAVINAPPPQEIIAKYVNAMGGAAALAGIKTRVEKGTITISGRNLPIEIFASSGGKQLTVIHLPNGDNVTAYDGTSGWTLAPNRSVRPLAAVEVRSARSEIDLQLPLRINELFDQLKTLALENIGDREAHVLAGMNSGEVAAKFYFDGNSGSLLRLLRYTKTPLGQNPTQIDYEDYREQAGVKVPFRFTISRPNSRVTAQIEEVRMNVALDEAKFAQPAASTTVNPHAP